jgi:hypothetical protein
MTDPSFGSIFRYYRDPYLAIVDWMTFVPSLVVSMLTDHPTPVGILTAERFVSGVCVANEYVWICHSGWEFVHGCRVHLHLLRCCWGSCEFYFFFYQWCSFSSFLCLCTVSYSVDLLRSLRLGFKGTYSRWYSNNDMERMRTRGYVAKSIFELRLLFFSSTESRNFFGFSFPVLRHCFVHDPDKHRMMMPSDSLCYAFL